MLICCLYRSGTEDVVSAMRGGARRWGKDSFLPPNKRVARAPAPQGGSARNSDTPIYVKVFNVQNRTHEYLVVKNPQAYEKVIASASLTPLTSRSIEVDGEELFDGDTIASMLEEDIVKNNPDKIVIKISNQPDSLVTRFNIPVLIIVSILLWSKYGGTVAQLYRNNFFKKSYWNNRLQKYKNVRFVTNEKSVSLFRKDSETLKRAYKYGLQKGRELTEEL
ncbi:hypothetical protein N8083_01455 [Candidatus Pacebacteria bacterium]|nr:hypothetical protein [Candidatus Paceibacterota bacterium]